MKKLSPRKSALLQAVLNRHQLPPVQRLGLLRAFIESPDLVGTPSHASYVEEAQRLELFARTRLTPEQLHVANLYAEQAKFAWKDRAAQDYRADLQEDSHRQVEDAVREMTHGMLGQTNGISRSQLTAIRNGGEIPREHQVRRSQAALDAEWRQMTRHLDPAGKGWGELEAVRRLDALVDAEPDSLATEAKKFRGSAASIRQEADKWNDQRIGYGLLKRRMDRDIQQGRARPDTHEPNDRDRRRAAVVDAYLKTTGDKVQSEMLQGKSAAFDDFEEAVPSHLLNETHDGKPTRRAQLAQAMAESDGDDE
jgi:hypothetical protein